MTPNYLFCIVPLLVQLTWGQTTSQYWETESEQVTELIDYEVTTELPLPVIESQEPVPLPQVQIGWGSEGLKNESTYATPYIGGQSYAVRHLLFHHCEVELYNGDETIHRKFSNYLSGYDDEGRPIWVAEWGKYDFKWVTSGGQERMEAFDNYTRYAVYSIVKSTFFNPDLGRPPAYQIIFIVDFEHLSFDQLGISSLAYLLKTVRQYFTLLDEYTHLMVFINMNYVAEILISVVRPVLGRIMERVEVFGTNKAKWIPFLRQHVPTNQIPKWYGGNDKNFKPILVNG